jgi:ADP-ribosylglycohydrolase
LQSKGSTTMTSPLYDKILGSLVTAGMGDGIGAPSEAMSRAEITARYGGRIETFIDGSDNPYALGNFVGEGTDDTSQMYEMAQAVIATGGHLTTRAVADALLTWTEKYPKYYPRNAGPTTRFVVNELRAGKDPDTVGMTGLEYGRGVSNGAAMRVASAGLIHPGDLDGAIETATIMSRPSHGTQHAYAGAAAIASAIAAALAPGADRLDIVKASLYGAQRGEEIGTATARVASGPSTLPMLTRAIQLGLEADGIEAAEEAIEREVGNDGTIQASVAAAMGLFVAADGDPRVTIIGGANLGGDTDTIACIAGSVAGAYRGFSSLPEGWYDIFKAANPAFDMERTAAELEKIARANLPAFH